MLRHSSSNGHNKVAGCRNLKGESLEWWQPRSTLTRVLWWQLQHHGWNKWQWCGFEMVNNSSRQNTVSPWITIIVAFLENSYILKQDGKCFVFICKADVGSRFRSFLIGFSPTGMPSPATWDTGKSMLFGIVPLSTGCCQAFLLSPPPPS